MQWNKVLSSILFLLLFLVKSSAFHAYSHDSDNSETLTHCTTCDIQQISQNTSLEGPTVIHIPEVPLFFLVKPKARATSEIIAHANFLSHIYSRPPPPVGVSI